MLLFCCITFCLSIAVEAVVAGAGAEPGVGAAAEMETSLPCTIWRCTICSVAFSSRASYSQHGRQVHSAEDDAHFARIQKILSTS